MRDGSFYGSMGLVCGRSIVTDMKILFISNLYPPYYIGGYELACKDVAEELQRRGHEVYVLTSTYGINKQVVEGNIYRKLYLHKTFYTSIPSIINEKYLEVYNYFTTREIAGNIDPDIVYIWSLNNLSLSPAIAVQETGLEVVFHIFDYWLRDYK